MPEYGYVWDVMPDESETPAEEISPEVAALLAALDVPVEILSFDYDELQ